MKGTYLQKKRSKESGNTFFTALVFMFVLIGTLRLCCNKTLHEAKLTGIFIQETQGYYLMENLMALARDYAYQITQNPREGNLFLSASSYRKKDKANAASKYVIDFNGSLSKQQIAPADFPLQIADNGWDIKGGPIFWQDKKKDSDDERWLSEVFMLGTLTFTSGLIPDWTMRMVQTMEIERNPLCDFQLYAEGDTSFTGNVSSPDSNWHINFYGPVQVNGNARFPYYMGNPGGGTKYSFFYKKFNIAGNALRVYSTYKSIKMPEKYHMQDNSTFYDSFTNPYSTGISYHYINMFAINYSSTSTTHSISGYGSSNSSTYPTTNYQTFEHLAFNTWWGNFSTRSRIYRPTGFDPLSYWGWWDSITNAGSAPTAGTGVDKSLLTLDLCICMHNLAKTSCQSSYYIYSKKFTNYNPFTHINSLRGLNNYQITEKARLVESQKVINFPALEFALLLKDKANLNSGLYIVNNVPYTTYDYTTYFPAKYDNFYLNRYLDLKSKNLSIIGGYWTGKRINSSYSYYFSSNDNPSSSPNIEEVNIYQCIKNNKLAYGTVFNDSFSSSVHTALNQNVFKQTTILEPTSYSDKTCPPHKILDCTDHWEEATNQTRVRMAESYQFMYDRNRAKWIQIIDFDVGALKDAIGSTISTAEWDAMNHTVKFNMYWQGDKRNACRNYTYPTYDIRYNYISNRTNFFNTYTNALEYAYPSSNKPVIDIGIRIINAKELPTGGLTILCPYPLYLQGNFNTTNTKPKALIITDSLTILSDKDNNSANKCWGDWKSQMDWQNSYLINPDGNKEGRVPPTIYAHIITGRTHPNYWLTANKNVLNPDLGIHDAIRTLENFGTPIKIYGSILLPFYCQQQWEPPINFCHYTRTPKSYAPINWYLGDGSQWKTMRTAPGMPFYHRINRGRKTQAIGETTYDILAGTTLYNKDWDSTSYTFSTYHSALPNYLKYEVAP